MRSRIRFAALVLLALSGVTCSDGPTAPNGRGGPAVLSVAPEFSAAGIRSFRALGAFGLLVDNIHIHIDHPPAPYDTVVTVPAGADSVAMKLRVTLNTNPEELTLELELRHGTEVLYRGTMVVTAKVGASTGTTATTVPITYVGPGADAAFFWIAPSDTTIPASGTVPYRITALDSTESPITGVVPAWTVLDSTLGVVNPSSGTFQPSGRAGTTRVIAAIPNGLQDTATVTIVGSGGARLRFAVQPSNVPSATYINPPIQVEVLDSAGNRDSTGASATAVVALGILHGPVGGYVGDSLGFAADTVQAAKGLATFHVGNNAVGTYTLIATSPGLIADTSASYVVSLGPPKHINVQIGSTTLTGAANDTTTQRPTIKVEDAGGNPVPGTVVTWTVSAGGGGFLKPDSLVPPALATVTTTTDSAGITAVLWELGANGFQQMRASVAGVQDTAVFNANISVSAAQMSFSNSFNSNYASGAAVPVVVQLLDTASNPVASAGVPIAISLDLNCYAGNRLPSKTVTPAKRPTGLLSPAPARHQDVVQAPSRATVQGGGGCQQPNRVPSRALTSGGPHYQSVPFGSGHWRSVPFPPDPTLIGDTVVLTDSTGKATFTNLHVAGYANEPFALVARDTTVASALYPLTSPAISLTAGPAYSVQVEYDSVHQSVSHYMVDYPAAVVIDSVGNGIPGVAVGMTLDAGGGSLDSTQLTTDPSGEILLTMWALGSASGPNKVILTAPVAGPHNRDTVVAIGHQPGALRIEHAPLSVQANAITLDTTVVSAADSTGTWPLNYPGLAITPSVILSPSGQSAGAPVLIGSASPVNTGIDGSARFGGFGIDGDLGSTAALVFSAPGVRPDTSAQISLVSGPPANMAPVGQGGLTIDPVGTSQATVAVHVTDTASYALGGVPVTYSLTTIGASSCTLADSASSATVNTDASGNATLTFNLPPNATSCQVVAYAYDLAGYMLNGAPVTFTTVVAPAGYSTWTGASDTSWTNAANWQGAVPTQSDSAFLPWATTSGATNGTYPTLNTDAGIGTLMVENGAEFDIHTHTLKVYGDLKAPTPSDVADWSTNGADTGTVEMMTPGSKVGVLMPTNLMIGDASMACAGAQPVVVVNTVYAARVDVNCPLAGPALASGVLGSSGNLNIMHHGTLSMTGSGFLTVEGNFNVTSDQSSEGLLTNGTIWVAGNFMQDTVPGVAASYKNFFSTGTALIMDNESDTTARTITATSSQAQFWNVTAEASGPGSVNLSPNASTTYTIKGSLTVMGSSGVEGFNVPAGITLNVGSLVLNSTSLLTVNGTLNSAAECDASLLTYILVGVNGIVTPASCHP